MLHELVLIILIGYMTNFYQEMKELWYFEVGMLSQFSNVAHTDVNLEITNIVNLGMIYI